MPEFMISESTYQRARARAEQEERGTVAYMRRKVKRLVDLFRTVGPGKIRLSVPDEARTVRVHLDIDSPAEDVAAVLDAGNIGMVELLETALCQRGVEPERAPRVDQTFHLSPEGWARLQAAGDVLDRRISKTFRTLAGAYVTRARSVGLEYDPERQTRRLLAGMHPQTVARLQKAADAAGVPFEHMGEVVAMTEYPKLEAWAAAQRAERERGPVTLLGAEVAE